MSSENACGNGSPQPPPKYVGFFSFTFPNGYNPPTQVFEPGILHAVSLNILVEFGLPEIPIAFRCIRIPASRVAVPVTAIYKNHSPAPWKDYVWTAWQIPAMKSEPKTHPMQQRANTAFRFGVLCADARHIPFTMFSRDCVHEPLWPSVPTVQLFCQQSDTKGEVERHCRPARTGQSGCPQRKNYPGMSAGAQPP